MNLNTSNGSGLMSLIEYQSKSNLKYGRKQYVIWSQNMLEVVLVV